MGRVVGDVLPPEAVIGLHRRAIGALDLDETLLPGQSRELSEQEAGVLGDVAKL